MSVITQPGQRCGHELRPGAQFCTVCGHRVAHDTQRTAPAAEEPAPAPNEVMPRHSGTTPRQGRQHRSRWPLVVAGAIALLAAGGAAVAVFIGQPLPNSHTVASTSRTVAPVAEQSVSASAAATLPPQSTQQQAADGIAGLLAQSVTDRSSIVNAASSVSQCGPALSQDPEVFESAASARQRLSSQLASLPGLSTLPGQMLQALTGAWQASAMADQDLARWAQDELSQGCTHNDQADLNFQAAAGPDSQATTDKKAFVNLWNPMAAKYGLPSYHWNQL